MRCSVILLMLLAGCGDGDGVGTTGTDVGNPIEVELQFTAFDMAIWLDRVDLSGAARAADGSIAVNQDSNRDLLERFEENVESRSRLFADADGDGALDDDGDALGAGSL